MSIVVLHKFSAKLCDNEARRLQRPDRIQGSFKTFGTELLHFGAHLLSPKFPICSLGSEVKRTRDRQQALGAPS